MSSHALLLRLFLSPSFFSVHVALKYLLIYADNIGITYYLTHRLKELEVQELTDVWGFICHLLITRPTKSRALECFVVETAQRSTHIALIPLSTILGASRRDSPSFAVCQRVLLRCHEIIFSDLTSANAGPYSGSGGGILSGLRRRKIKHHAEPVIVGIGALLAGTPGLPQLTNYMGQIAIDQGRAEDEANPRGPSKPSVDDDFAPPQPSPPRSVVDEDEQEDPETPSSEGPDTPTLFSQKTPTIPKSNLLHTAADCRRGSRPVPALPLHLRTKRKSRASTDDPLGQRDAEQHSTTPIPILTFYTLSYVFSSALRAELTALNHKLPAEVCLPLWEKRQLSTPHHRIVRIPPGESVVLNSAERAPFLLLVEVLHDDLDFDPVKKSNKEVLRNIVLKGSRQKGDEEIDLVEQLYGNDQPLGKMIDFSESIVLPPTPKNKELDLAAWSRTPPIPQSASYLGSPHSRSPSRIALERANSAPLASTPSTPENGSRDGPSASSSSKTLSLDEYSERMRTAAIMLAQLNEGGRGGLVTASPRPDGQGDGSNMRRSMSNGGEMSQQQYVTPGRLKLNNVETSAIRDRIMKEMLALEEERVARMQEGDSVMVSQMGETSGSSKTMEDESIIRRELNKVDPSAVVFSESWAAKKSRIRQSSPYGHLARWDCMSVIVKTGGDLRQEQLAVQLIREFQAIWTEEKSGCWVKHFRIMITGSTSGLIETIKDAVSIHSIKKAEYAKRLAEGRLGHVTLLDHFKSTYGDPSSAKFARAQRNFAKSLAGYSLVTYLLQVKDRHNGNILLDRDGHLIHIDFGFILSNTPGNIGFEAAPFKFPPEYLEVLGGAEGPAFLEFKRLFREGFEAARKHCDRIITLVELMQRESALPCFAIYGDQTATQLRDRFQPTLTHSLVGNHVERLITASIGSHWTRLYDSFQYYSQSIL
ncbi:kinase-like protein [Coprinellus micaceus]|uniref:1-phosphatidylinositol 4-kinase n=1 Tax=Coprinellus micaceus TaxID=71717 RepID=A0A4Y7TAT6_COPMI|nr:kinase-like protein [Coprinellus micaceus]